MDNLKIEDSFNFDKFTASNRTGIWVISGEVISGDTLLIILKNNQCLSV